MIGYPMPTWTGQRPLDFMGGDPNSPDYLNSLGGFLPPPSGPVASPGPNTGGGFGAAPYGPAAPAGAPTDSFGFRPLTADPAMRAALGITTPEPQTRGQRYLDSFARSLAGVQFAPISPRAKGGTQLLQGLLEGAAKGFAGGRLADMAERDKQAEKSDERMKQINAMDVEYNLAGRNQAAKDARELARKTAEDAKRKAEWPILSSVFASAYGKPDLAGQQVPPEVATLAVQQFNAQRMADSEARQARNSSISSDDKLTPQQRYQLQVIDRKETSRVAQMQRRIDELNRLSDGTYSATDPRLKKFGGLSGLASKIDDLSGQIDSVHDSYDAMRGKVLGVAVQPVTPTGTADLPGPGAQAAAAPADAGPGYSLMWTGSGQPTNAQQAEKLGRALADVRTKRSARQAEIAAAGGNPALTDLGDLQKQESALAQRLQGMGYAYQASVPVEATAKAPPGVTPSAGAASAKLSQYGEAKVQQAKGSGMSLADFSKEVEANRAALAGNGVDPDALLSRAKAVLK